MKKLFIAFYLGVYASSACYAMEVFHLSSYKAKYNSDLTLKESSGKSRIIDKNYINAFLVAKKNIEIAANLPPFDAAIINDAKFNAAMFDNGLRGNLYITLGALEEIKDDVSLYAALIGHEAGHYIHQHREKRYDRKLYSTIATTIALGIVAFKSGVTSPQDSAEIADIAMIIGSDLATPFGKEDEH